MRRTLFAVLLTAASASAQTAPNPAGGAIAPPLSPRNASYTIAATLDPSTHTIYLAATDYEPQPAGAKGRPKAVVGTFRVLTYQMK